MFRLGRVRVIKPVSVFVNTSCHSMSTTEEPPFRCRIEPSSFLITEDFVRHSHISRQVSFRKIAFLAGFFPTKSRPGNCLLPQTHPRDKQRVEVHRPESASRTADVRIARSKNCPQTSKLLRDARDRMRDHRAEAPPCHSFSRNLPIYLMTFAFHQSPPTHYPLRSLDGRGGGGGTGAQTRPFC